MMVIYWISMYLVVFAVIWNVLGIIFTKKGWFGPNVEASRLFLSFSWILWLEVALICGILYFAIKYTNRFLQPVIRH